jgi:hypothetical protein
VAASDLELDCGTEPKKKKEIFVVTCGECLTGANPLHTTNGTVMITALAKTVKRLEKVSMVIVGMGRRHDQLGSIVRQAIKNNTNVGYGYSPFCGGAEIEFVDNDEVFVVMANGDRIERKSYAGIAQMPNGMAWAIVDFIADGDIMVADQQLVEAFGFPDISHEARLYRLVPADQTVTMIG